jgi:hypothetical protein
MLLSIVKARALALEDIIAECKRRDEEEVDNWTDENSPPFNFYVTRHHRVRELGRPSSSELRSRLAAARISCPLALWEPPEDGTCSMIPLPLITAPRPWTFEMSLTEPLCWFWGNLGWSDNEDGISWIELYLDFTLATGVRVAKRGQGKWTLALAARCFREASAELALAGGVTFWRGVEDHVVFLRPFRFDSVAGLRSRPRLIMKDSTCRVLVELGQVDLSRVEMSSVESLLCEVEPLRLPFVERVRGILNET